MALYRPQYIDHKTGELKHTKIWYYRFVFAGRLIQESAKTTSKTVAKEAEKRRRRHLEEGFNGIVDAREDRIRSVRELARAFLKDYRVRQPRSASFATYALGHVERLLGDLMTVDVTDKTVMRYQTERLTEKGAPKSVNGEVGFFLRLLPIAQAGAIRAQLKQQKRLKLKVPMRVGKAYTEEEKAALLQAAKARPRSKSIYLQTLLAQVAGLRDREIRTLQWSRLNLETRIVTVGESKSDAGTGRTIPMKDELLAAAVEYTKWYTERFGTTQPDWYVFPFGKPRPKDPTQPQTTFKTAWRNSRAKAEVKGRFHDNRHTFVTDLAESGASDQMIQDLAGQVSSEMVKRYSHLRMEAKRRAIEALSAKPERAKKSDGVVQDSVQAK